MNFKQTTIFKEYRKRWDAFLKKRNKIKFLFCILNPIDGAIGQIREKAQLLPILPSNIIPKRRSLWA